MFSFFNSKNNIDLSQGKRLLEFNKNNENKMASNLDLIGDNGNVTSIIEAMSDIDSVQAGNTINANNIIKTNEKFNEAMVEYSRDYKLLIEQVLQNQNNPILQKYAGKNVKLEGSDNEYYYVNNYGFLQKYNNFERRPLSCQQEAINIPNQDFTKLPLGQDVPSGVDCGLEGNNVQDETTGEFSWINIKGERFDYPTDMWDKRSTSCKEANLKKVNTSNIVGLTSSGNLTEDSLCNRLHADPTLLNNVQNLNKKLTRLGEEILVDIEKLSISDIETQSKINTTRDEISKKLKELRKDFVEIKNGEFTITNEFNPNLEELRRDTRFRARSNFTRYLLLLFIAILLIILTVYTLLSNNNNIMAQSVIAFVCIYAIYLFLRYIYNLVF